MLDTQIVSACMADRRAYDRIKDHTKDNEFSPPMAFWMGQIRDYYSRDPVCSSVDKALLSERAAQDITNPKHKQPLMDALASIEPTSAENVVDLVLQLKRYNLSMEFAAAVSSADRKKADKLLAELNEIWSASDIVSRSEIEYAKDWGEIDQLVGSGARIPIGPRSLDNRIGGGVLPGHHVCIFGRTEIGKSCLAISVTASLLKQGLPVLYCGNEDEINILKARMRLALLEKSQDWVDSHPNKAKRLLSELVGEKLTMVKMVPGSMSELEDLTAKHSPKVLILDQIRNLSGPEDGMTQKMEANAIRFRSLLSRNRLIGLSVTQAGNRSQGHNEDGPLYLNAGDVDSSRVGLPGTVDVMIGVGANRELLTRGLRMLSLAKNKAASGSQSREPLLVRFDLERSLVTDGV